jgi:hypothetical protein
MSGDEKMSLFPTYNIEIPDVMYDGCERAVVNIIVCAIVEYIHSSRVD